MHRVNEKKQEHLKRGVVSLYEEACRGSRPPMPGEIIESRVQDLNRDFSSLHAVIAVQRESHQVQEKVQGALLLDGRDGLRCTQILVNKDLQDSDLPGLLFHKATISKLAFGIRNFGFLLSDQDAHTLRLFQNITRSRVQQLTPYISLPFDPGKPELGSVNLAYFWAPFDAFYEAARSSRSRLEDFEFFFSHGATLQGPDHSA